MEKTKEKTESKNIIIKSRIWNNLRIKLSLIIGLIVSCAGIIDVISTFQQQKVLQHRIDRNHVEPHINSHDTVIYVVPHKDSYMVQPTDRDIPISEANNPFYILFWLVLIFILAAVVYVMYRIAGFKELKKQKKI